MSTLFAVLMLGVSALPDGGADPCPRDGGLVEGCQRVLHRTSRRVGACTLSTERVQTVVRCDASAELELHERERGWVTAPDGGVDLEPRLAVNAPGCESANEHATVSELDGGFLRVESVPHGELYAFREDGTSTLTYEEALSVLLVDAHCRFARVPLTGAFLDASTGERMVIESPDGVSVTVRYSSRRRPTPQQLEVTAWTPQGLSAELKFKDGSRFRLGFDAEGVLVTPVKKGAVQRFALERR